MNFTPCAQDCCAHIGTQELYRRFPKGSYVTVRHSSGPHLFQVLERDGGNKIIKVKGFIQAINPTLKGHKIWVHACQCTPIMIWYEAELL